MMMAGIATPAKTKSPDLYPRPRVINPTKIPARNPPGKEIKGNTAQSKAIAMA